MESKRFSFGSSFQVVQDEEAKEGRSVWTWPGAVLREQFLRYEVRIWTARRVRLVRTSGSIFRVTSPMAVARRWTRIQTQSSQHDLFLPNSSLLIL
jgi:hypothetical protein